MDTKTPPVTKFETLPKIIFGEVAVCPRCRARTKRVLYEKYGEVRHKDPFQTTIPCQTCNGFGFVPNHGPVASLPDEP